MKVDNLKTLKKLIHLCQTQGVRAIEIDGIKMELDSKPQPVKRYKQASDSINFPPTVDEDIQIPRMDNIDTPDELSDEDLMFYSAPTVQTENPS